MSAAEAANNAGVAQRTEEIKVNKKGAGPNSGSASRECLEGQTKNAMWGPIYKFPPQTASSYWPGSVTGPTNLTRSLRT